MIHTTTASDVAAGTSARIPDGSLVPGSAFALPRGASLTNCMRLSFSRESPARIAEGIGRLSRLIRSHEQRWISRS